MAADNSREPFLTVDDTVRALVVRGGRMEPQDGRRKTATSSRRRSRQPVRRKHSVRFVLTDEEYGEVGEAAAQAGMAKGAYAAHATLAAARGLMNPADAPFRQALTELIRAAGLVRRIGVNLNQAVAKLNATGQRSGDLLPYAAECARRAQRLDVAAETVRRRLR